MECEAAGTMLALGEGQCACKDVTMDFTADSLILLYLTDAGVVQRSGR